MQLNAWGPRFEKLGIRVAASTLDRVRPLRKFSDRHEIRFPLLYDRRYRIANIFEIRDRSQRRHDQAFGAPHPGIMFIDKQGKILAKAAERGFRKRPKLEDVYRLVVTTLRNQLSAGRVSEQADSGEKTSPEEPVNSEGETE